MGSTVKKRRGTRLLVRQKSWKKLMLFFPAAQKLEKTIAFFSQASFTRVATGRERGIDRVGVR